MKKGQLVSELADACEMSTQDVQQVLERLAKLAYREAKTGFVLPGFGEFKVEQGPEKTMDNPFTGEPFVVPGKLEVTFQVDDTALESFVGDDSGPKKQRKTKKKPPKPVVRPSVTEKVTFGGEAAWIHHPEHFQCCGQEMSFYGQIHSDSLGDEYMIYDCGVIYLFLCESCKKTKTTVQYY